MNAKILTNLFLLYDRRQQRQATSDKANAKEDKANKMAERNPSSETSRAVANIYVVAVPRPSSDVPEVEPVSATWASNHLPTFDDETPLGGLHLASTDDFDEAATKYDCPTAEINELYAEIADDNDDDKAVEHIYESLNDYCIA